MSPLLNYTTEIAARKSFMEIQDMLSSHGVESVLTQYDDRRQPLSISFRIRAHPGMLSYRLEANVDAVERALKDQVRRGEVQPRFAKREAAERVAWRILRTKVSADLAMVAIGLAAIDEIMLPYLLLDSGQTLYQAMLVDGLQTQGQRLMLGRGEPPMRSVK